MRGPWGYNKLVRPLFVGHPLRCPECSQSWKPYFPEVHGPAGWRGRVRLGLEQPAWLGLVVENATFINYDREGMVAVGGFSKAFPLDPTGYDFSHAGAMETRFSGVTWLQSPNRVRWRWNDEALFYDIDGTFADQPFCAGCSVLKNNLVSDPDAFPDCYQDARYDGTVCKPTYKIVQAGFLPEDPLMLIETMRAEKSFDTIPNFTAADCGRLVGVGRNEFLHALNQCRSKGWLWKRRRAIIASSLPAAAALPTMPLRFTLYGLNAERGRGRYSFWIHTLSPPPDFELSG
jgi:hypothetical protein